MTRRNSLVVAVLACLLLVVGSAAALAQEESGTVEGNEQQPEVQADTVQPAAEVEGSVEDAAEGGGNTLPFTGADVTLFVIIGVAAIGTGTLIVRRTRPSKAS
jgi:LPXTG-motif cell wall-anchored protein